MKNQYKTVLVTGGAGYVGAVLIPKLLTLGYQVKVFDWYIFEPGLFNQFKGNKNFIRIKGDLRDKKLVEKSLSGVDAVIHLACISNDPSFELDPAFGKSVNFDASIKLIDLSKKLGVRRFIYASSSSVYGVKKEKNVTEDLVLEPLTDYSRFKAMIEKYLHKAQSDKFHVLILRPATVCGYSPRMRLDLTVNLLTMQALVNKKMTVFGGKQLRPNIHIEDMVDIYYKSLKYPDGKISGKVYNVGYENYSVGEIAQMIKQTLSDKEMIIEIVPTNDNRSYHVSSAKIARELGFVATHTVQEAIRDIQKAYKSGLIPNPFTDNKYFNVKTMKQFEDKFSTR